MIDFASLFWFAAYGMAFLMIGLVLRLVAETEVPTEAERGVGGDLLVLDRLGEHGAGRACDALDRVQFQGLLP